MNIFFSAAGKIGLNGRNQLLALALAGLCAGPGSFPGICASAAVQKPTLSVRAERNDALYQQGQIVTFIVELSGGLTNQATLDWKISKDGVPPIKTGQVSIGQTPGKVTATLAEPGFLLCEVSGKVGGESVRSFGGAGVDPLRIGPSMHVPDDFEAFWAEQRRKLAQVPMAPALTAVPAATNIECFDVQLQCAGGAPVSGYYSRPREASAQSLPAILLLHGAGVNSAGKPGTFKWCEKGMLALEINAHGLPNGQPAEFYDELGAGKLKGYPSFGRSSREESYFLGMFLRVFRAVDFLAAQPEWDGKTIIAYGSSQGGFQAFAAGLDKRVSFIAAGVPAGCDHTGVVVGRVNGWPKLVQNGADGKSDPKMLEASRYFDCVNFAARTHAKGAFVTVGFIDQTCPPSTVYAAYNALRIPKKIFNDIPTGHANSPEATRARDQAVMNYVKSVRR